MYRARASALLLKHHVSRPIIQDLGIRSIGRMISGDGKEVWKVCSFQTIFTSPLGTLFKNFLKREYFRYNKTFMIDRVEKSEEILDYISRSVWKIN